MVCADQPIHNQELKALHELATQTRVGQRTLEEMEKIIAQDDDHLSLEEVARQIERDQQHEAIYRGIVIAYIDRSGSALERRIVERIAQIWNWQKEEIRQQLELAEAFIEKLELEILLSGRDYDEAVRQCSNIAREDYQFAESALKKTGSILLYDLIKSLKQVIENAQYRIDHRGGAKTAREVTQQLEETQKNLQTEISKKIEYVQESLRSKERALNNFTIAFMGKTKAGKSTLHAIITDNKWEAIGEGKQRTTRENRVYQWKNLRIIDTPGIGAPGGKSDEEIAESVIEESDVICYVVTNDSIQETEFKFLRLLKEQAKPLIILLNVKKNLRDPRRLEHFLKDPDKAFEMEGQSGLGGHIERIRRYAKEHYANDYFPIVPVMLLAAQLSREPEHKNRKEELFKASRMQDFLDSMRESVIQYGTIRRSQTLLGSTVGAIDIPYHWVKKQSQDYHQLAEKLTKKRKDVQNKIEIASKDSSNSLQTKIEAVFQEAINAVPSFAEEHWNSNEQLLKNAWDKRLKSLNFERRLKSAFQEACEQFKHEVQETLEEVGNELKLIAELGNDNFSFTSHDSFNTRNFMRIGGSILLTLGVAIGFVAPPIGIAIGIVGSLVSMISGFFKSQEQKRREAVHKISQSLKSQLNIQKEKTLKKAKSEFFNSCASVKANIDSYFKELTYGLENMSQELAEAQEQLHGQVNYLNCAYAKRILDWSQEKYEPLTEEGARKTVAKVQRKFGHKMTIITRSELTIKKSMDELKNVLQEDISIQSHKSVK
jgi:small GTP-binding protein